MLGWGIRVKVHSTKQISLSHFGVRYIWWGGLRDNSPYFSPILLGFFLITYLANIHESIRGISSKSNQKCITAGSRLARWNATFSIKSKYCRVWIFYPKTQQSFLNYDGHWADWRMLNLREEQEIEFTFPFLYSFSRISISWNFLPPHAILKIGEDEGQN